MPELPEVEVICEGLRPHLLHRIITTIHSSGKSLRYPVPLAAMNESLGGQTISSVTRRAKYLLIGTNNEMLLIIHLGMTGNLGIFPHSAPVRSHDHVRWQMDNGLELRLHDARRFGAVWLLTPEQARNKESGFFGNTGPEPFSPLCTPAHFLDLARKRHQPVKNFLMDNKVVAGIGNIYANEILFAAALHPLRPVNTLAEGDWQRLIPLMQRILTQAIASGGSTISDFINASGESGYFQLQFMVYGRKNQPCLRCGTAIEKMQIGGRASFFCPRCQQDEGNAR